MNNSVNLPSFLDKPFNLDPDPTQASQKLHHDLKTIAHARWLKVDDNGNFAETSLVGWALERFKGLFGFVDHTKLEIRLLRLQQLLAEGAEKGLLTKEDCSEKDGLVYRAVAQIGLTPGAANVSRNYKEVDSLVRAIHTSVMNPEQAKPDFDRIVHRYRLNHIKDLEPHSILWKVTHSWQKQQKDEEGETAQGEYGSTQDSDHPKQEPDSKQPEQKLPSPEILDLVTPDVIPTKQDLSQQNLPLPPATVKTVGWIKTTGLFLMGAGTFVGGALYAHINHFNQVKLADPVKPTDNVPDNIPVFPKPPKVELVVDPTPIDLELGPPPVISQTDATQNAVPVSSTPVNDQSVIDPLFSVSTVLDYARNNLTVIGAVALTAIVGGAVGGALVIHYRSKRIQWLKEETERKETELKNERKREKVEQLKEEADSRKTARRDGRIISLSKDQIIDTVLFKGRPGNDFTCAHMKALRKRKSFNYKDENTSFKTFKPRIEGKTLVISKKDLGVKKFSKTMTFIITFSAKIIKGQQQNFLIVNIPCNKGKTSHVCAFNLNEYGIQREGIEKALENIIISREEIRIPLLKAEESTANTEKKEKQPLKENVPPPSVLDTPPSQIDPTQKASIDQDTFLRERLNYLKQIINESLELIKDNKIGFDRYKKQFEDMQKELDQGDLSISFIIKCQEKVSKLVNYINNPFDAPTTMTSRMAVQAIGEQEGSAAQSNAVSEPLVLSKEVVKSLLDSEEDLRKALVTLSQTITDNESFMKELRELQEEEVPDLSASESEKNNNKKKDS